MLVISQETRDRISTVKASYPAPNQDANVGKIASFITGTYEGIPGIVFPKYEALRYLEIDDGIYEGSFYTTDKPYVLMMFYDDGTVFCATPATALEVGLNASGEGTVGAPYSCNHGMRHYSISFDTTFIYKLGDKAGTVYLEYEFPYPSDKHSVELYYINDLNTPIATTHKPTPHTYGGLFFYYDPQFNPDKIVALINYGKTSLMGWAYRMNCPGEGKSTLVGDGYARYPYLCDTMVRQDSAWTGAVRYHRLPLWQGNINIIAKLHPGENLKVYNKSDTGWKNPIAQITYDPSMLLTEEFNAFATFPYDPDINERDIVVRFNDGAHSKSDKWVYILECPEYVDGDGTSDYPYTCGESVLASSALSATNYHAVPDHMGKVSIVANLHPGDNVKVYYAGDLVNPVDAVGVWASEPPGEQQHVLNVNHTPATKGNKLVVVVNDGELRSGDSWSYTVHCPPKPETPPPYGDIGTVGNPYTFPTSGNCVSLLTYKKVKSTAVYHKLPAYGGKIHLTLWFLYGEIAEIYFTSDLVNPVAVADSRTFPWGKHDIAFDIAYDPFIHSDTLLIKFKKGNSSSYDWTMHLYCPV